MAFEGARSMMPGRCKRLGGVALVSVTAILLVAPAGTAQTCIGDCNGDGVVGLGEVQTGFNIFLETTPGRDCPGFDANDDGQVTLGEVQTSFNQYLGVCGPGADRLIVRGTCRLPSATGLASCDQGTAVTVSTCDQRVGCLAEASARTRLGVGFVDAVGAFSAAIDRRVAGGALLLLEAEIRDAVLYRAVTFGPLGQGAGAGDQVVVIDVVRPLGA